MRPLNNYIQLKSRFAHILVVLVLAMVFSGPIAWAEDLFLSEAQDISNVGLAGVNVQESPGFGQVRSTDRQQSLSLESIRTKSLTCTIDTADCVLSKRPDGSDDLAIRGLPHLTDLGQPQVPMKTLTIKLDKNVEVLGIEVVGGSYRQILNSVNLATSSQPFIWMKQEKIPDHVRKRFESALLEVQTNSSGTYFPGQIATYSTGRDNDATYVYVRVFPVQYIPQSNESILVTDARIDVYYSPSEPQAKLSASPRRPDPAECVIICPSQLKEAAELLRDFHTAHENVSTSVVTTEDIDATYSAAPEPPYTGYSGNYAGKDKIVGYRYDLARKIIAYLRDSGSHPNLKYVTLFGDGQLVPPSYYINEWAVYTWYSGAYYEDWIPTDFLYSSPDYDFIPNYRVGRLPVSDASQATSIVQKIERWHSSLSWDWFKRASVVGGRPFGTMWYYGELGTVDLINRNLFDGMELTKYFHTNGTLDVAHVKPLLTTEDSGLFYHIDHGSGHKLWLGDEAISVPDLMISSSPRSPLFNPEVPIVVSVSCINGAYDTDLTAFNDQPQFPAIPSPTSFGESVVLSNAGGIAYVGGSRLNYADWSTFYDEGRFLAHHYYMDQICGSVIESYHTGASRLGDMTYDALRFYTQDNSMESRTNRETIFGFVLLGDPVLSVPAQQPGLTCQKPRLAAVEPDRISSEGIPVYKNLPLDQSRSIRVVSTSDSPTLDVKSIYVWHDTMVGADRFSVGSPTHTFTPNGCGYHLVRSSAADGKEGWLYLNAQFEFNAASNVLLIDGDYGEAYETYYKNALDRLGRTCDVWEAGARDPVDTKTLAQYRDGVVIWALPFACPEKTEKDACRSYLDGGGRLFITGQDIGYCLARSGRTDEFYQNYLHAQYVKDDSRIDTLSGTPRDPIGNGLTLKIWGGDGAFTQYWPDEIKAISPAVPVFSYEPGREAALRVDTGTYKVVYFGFGFEGINSQADRDETMKRVLDWLLPGSQGR